MHLLRRWKVLCHSSCYEHRHVLRVSSGKLQFGGQQRMHLLRRRKVL